MEGIAVGMRWSGPTDRAAVKVAAFVLKYAKSQLSELF